MAAPSVWVQVGGRRFTARARGASPAEREPLWLHMARILPLYNEYAQKTDREIPIVLSLRRTSHSERLSNHSHDRRGAPAVGHRRGRPGAAEQVPVGASPAKSVARGDWPHPRGRPHHSCLPRTCRARVGILTALS
ncbi:nitroreductase family deazaflavin-dependent oxidoreductase [Streptomyces violaceus]